MIELQKIKIGDRLWIHSYKHDGSIHRAWDEAVVLDITDEYIVCGNRKTKVFEKKGSCWRTKEPAIMYFFHERWFNIIAQLKKDGLYFYCNVATPFIVEDNTIKYIDYDLDLRVFPSGELKVLDEMEYTYHRNKMQYSAKLDLAIKRGLEDLIRFFKNKPELISDDAVQNYYRQYLKLRKK